MAFYEFLGFNCPNAPVDEETGERARCAHTISFPMSEAPGIGQQVACPVEGCPHKVTRVMSTGVGVIIKGDTPCDLSDDDHVYHMPVNGEDVRFSFVDHKHTHPKYQQQISKQARHMGIKSDGLGSMSHDEKHDRSTVQVVSNVPDPLGKIAAARRNATPEVTRHDVNQKVKRRKPRKKS